jgi:hypothetical protein
MATVWRPLPSRCLYCGRARAERRDICDAPGCRTLKAAALLSERRRRREQHAAVEELMRRHEAELRARHADAIPATVVRARLPAFEQTMGPLPEERRADFLESVKHSIERAFEDPRDPEPEVAKAEDPDGPLIQAACTSCRGACCRFGGTRAFLNPDHFRHYRRRHPGKSRDEMLEDYRKALPAMTCRDSCVFHTNTGCALPRDMRADVCNSWLCSGISRMLAAQPEGAPALPVLSFCIRKERAELVRSTLFDGRSTTVLHESPPAE